MSSFVTHVGHEREILSLQVAPHFFPESPSIASEARENRTPRTNRNVNITVIVVLYHKWSSRALDVLSMVGIVSNVDSDVLQQDTSIGNKEASS